MSFFKIDEVNQIYYEFIEPKNNGYTFVFVNALTGNTTAWNGAVGQKIIEDGNGFLAYNFRGQERSKFDNKLNLDIWNKSKSTFNPEFVSIVDEEIDMRKDTFKK